MRNFEVRFAETDEEKAGVYRLRYEAFDLGSKQTAGTPSAVPKNTIDTIDMDEYDQYCSHLIVIQKETKLIVGTYRLQDVKAAQKGKGFCSAELFEIQDFGDSVLENSFELSRACIHKDYRNGRVLYLLWKKLMEYSLTENKKYLFGSCSFPGTNPKEASQIYSYIREKNYYHSSYAIRTKGRHIVPALKHYKDFEPPNLPPLFKAYIRNGCKICSEPALDFSFNSFDFIIFMDLELRAKTRTQKKLDKEVFAPYYMQNNAVLQQRA